MVNSECKKGTNTVATCGRQLKIVESGAQVCTCHHCFNISCPTFCVEVKGTQKPVYRLTCSSSDHLWRSSGIPATNVLYCTITGRPYAHAPAYSLPPSSTQPVWTDRHYQPLTDTLHYVVVDNPNLVRRTLLTIYTRFRSISCLLYFLCATFVRTNPESNAVFIRKTVRSICVKRNNIAVHESPTRLAVKI